MPVRSLTAYSYDSGMSFRGRKRAAGGPPGADRGMGVPYGRSSAEYTLVKSIKY